MTIFKKALDKPLEKVKNANAYFRYLGETSERTFNYYMRMFVIPPGGYMPLHKHRRIFHLQLVLEGELEITVDNEKYGVSKGDVIYIPSGAKHKYVNNSSSNAIFICVTPKWEDETIIIEE